MVKSLRAVLAWGVMCGCYVAGSAPRAEETVAGRLAWIGANLVPVEYRHLATSPLVGPYYVLVSLSRHYCVVPDFVYVTVHDNERWACDWRPVRPAGIRVVPRAAADTLLPRIQD